MGSIINYAKAQLKAKFSKPVTAIILFILPLFFFFGTIPAAKFMFPNGRENDPNVRVSKQHIFMNIAALSFYIIYTITAGYDVVKERQILRKQHMFANGFSNLKFYFAWTLVYTILILPTTIVMIVVMYFVKLFPHVNIIVQFVDFFLLQLSGITVAFWVATYVPIALIGSIVVAFFNISFAGAYFGMAYIPDNVKETLCLFVSPMTYGGILNNFQHAEMRGDSIGLVNLIPGKGGEYSVFAYTFKLIFNNILYISFACLFDKLFKHLNRNPSELKKEKDFETDASQKSVNTITNAGNGITKIAAHKVYKYYFNKKTGETSVLENVNFGVCEGETFAIVGEKGSGKSTLMKLLCGREVPSYGVVDVSAAIGLDQLGVMSTIASVAPEDDYVVFEEASVADNIKYYTSLIKNKVRMNGFDILKGLNFEKSVSTKYSKLDKVEKAKVKAAIAFICNKDVLFFDEPTTDMSENDKEAFWKILNASKQGKTVIFTSTSEEEATQYADRALVLKNGKVVSIGKLGLEGKTVNVNKKQLEVMVEC